MSVYIFGIEMPIFEHQSWDIRHGTDGKWYITDINAETSDGEWHEIVHVPEHGRLGDLDAAVELAMQYCPDDDGACSKAGSDLRELLDEIEGLPTIIPADKEGE